MKDSTNNFKKNELSNIPSVNTVKVQKTNGKILTYNNVHNTRLYVDKILSSNTNIQKIYVNNDLVWSNN